MQSILVLFNGIKFPYHLLEYALAQAKENAASVHALFLKSKEETDEGYGFPSDLDGAQAVTDSEDARKDDESIIRHHMKLAQDMAASENIAFTMELKTDSPLAEVLTKANDADLVYLDASFDDDTPAMLTSNRFTAEELMERASSTVKLVKENS